MTLQASPDDLEAHAHRVAHLSVQVHRTAGQLAPALDRLRAAENSHQAVGVVPPVAEELREVASRLTALAELSGGVAHQLRAADDTPTVELSLRDRDDRSVVLTIAAELSRRPHERAAPVYDPARWAATPRGREALAEAQHLLRSRGGRVRRSDVDDLERLVLTLPPELADAVVAGLGDGALERLVAAVHGSRWIDARPIDERHRLWTAIGSRVSLPTFRRLVALTDDLDPDPRLAEDLEQIPRLIRLGIIPHERWFRELIHAPRPGPLTWRGEGDAHRVDPSDVTQGVIGNCYLIAAIISAARLDPDRVEAMFTEHPSGLVTVRFADGVEVTVTPDLPVHPDDLTVTAFAGRRNAGHRNAGHRDVADGQHERWPKLLEKAVVQRLDGGWSEAALGQPGTALRLLLGGRNDQRYVHSSRFSEDAPAARPLPRRSRGTDQRQVRRDLAAGRSVIAATLPREHRSDEVARAQAAAPAGRQLTPQHAYVVLDLDEDGIATVRDPNRPHDATQRIPWDDLLDATFYLDVTDLDP